jgi:hypothetical protein
MISKAEPRRADSCNDIYSSAVRKYSGVFTEVEVGTVESDPTVAPVVLANASGANEPSTVDFAETMKDIKWVRIQPTIQIDSSGVQFYPRKMQHPESIIYCALPLRFANCRNG